MQGEGDGCCCHGGKSVLVRSEENENMVNTFHPKHMPDVDPSSPHFTQHSTDGSLKHCASLSLLLSLLTMYFSQLRIL